MEKRRVGNSGPLTAPNCNADCSCQFLTLQRYSAKEVNVDVHFEKSDIAGRPTIHICPEFSEAYNKSAMKILGIEKGRYKNGDWTRTGLNEHDVFDKVTYNLAQILTGIEFAFNRGHDQKYYGTKLEDLDWTSLAYQHFGRCFGIKLDQQFNDLKAVTIVSKMDAIIWVHQDGQLLSPDGKTKFEILSKNKCLFLSLTYNIFRKGVKNTKNG